ncbi:MAG: translational GTPase TypA [Chloroflexota bacterium]|nr:translational GTPase TypA [Chloroflexota bacterium]
MPGQTRQDIRNVAIIAHVDHGKTTLVDALLKQSHTFRANQQMGDLIMDSNPLERERGITILAKNTAITYKGVKINIIDTPGHADFSGEVERVLNMADGCLLVVDAVDGPMPQTRYVLKKAFEKGLKPVVVVNKIDRSTARPQEVVRMVQDLFLELATESDQLDFPILYASARQGWAITSLEDPRRDVEPLFQAIVDYVPPPSGDAASPLQLLVAALTYDNHLGQIVIGRLSRGRIAVGDTVVRLDREGRATPFKVERVFVFQGLERRDAPSAEAGEIVAVAGVEQVSIGDTIASAEHPEALPPIDFEEPRVKMTFGVNSSAFAGREGTYCTARQLRERLARELRINLSLRVQDTDSADEFLVSGRGELHLSILIENMRRDGYELQVSRPEAVTKEVNGRTVEPFELLLLDTREEFIGSLTENLSSRLAHMTDMRADGQGNVHMEFRLPTRGLIGFRSFYMRTTRGNGVMNSQFLGYEPMEGEVRSPRMGALVASEGGVAVTYGLNNAQGRGATFVEPSTQVYEGMIVGMHPRESDILMNVCKEKKLTNMRSSTSDIAIRLTPAVKFSLEESLDFINDDELVEVTPASIRLRKKVLSNDARYRKGRDRVHTAE